MNKTINLILISIFLFSLLIISVSAVGTCTLNKITYIPTETALFSCTCTAGGEQAIAGNIVWKKSDGTILRTIASNSGTCQTNFFFDTFSFPNFGNWSGNVTFETSAASWNNIADIRFKNYILTTANQTDCIIKNLKKTQNADLGRYFSIQGNIKKASNSNQSIGGVSCNVVLEDILGNPLLIFPDNKDFNLFYRSTSEGLFNIQHLLIDKEFKTNTSYIARVNCFCQDEEGKKCFNLVTGNNEFVKSCEQSFIFNTGSDKRIKDTNLSIVGVMFLAIMIMFLLFYFSNLLGEEHEIFKIIILIFFVLFLLIFAGFISQSTINTGYENVGNSLYKVLTIFSYILVAYIFLYFLFHVILLFYNNAQMKNKGGGQ